MLWQILQFFLFLFSIWFLGFCMLIQVPRFLIIVNLCMPICKSKMENMLGVSIVWMIWRWVWTSGQTSHPCSGAGTFVFFFFFFFFFLSELTLWRTRWESRKTVFKWEHLSLDFLQITTQLVIFRKRAQALWRGTCAQWEHLVFRASPGHHRNIHRLALKRGVLCTHHPLFNFGSTCIGTLTCELCGGYAKHTGMHAASPTSGILRSSCLNWTFTFFFCMRGAGFFVLTCTAEAATRYHLCIMVPLWSLFLLASWPIHCWIFTCTVAGGRLGRAFWQVFWSLHKCSYTMQCWGRDSEVRSLQSKLTENYLYRPDH